ncbi:MAG: hypothetical protein ACRD3F_11270 [Acidobacteriaceae bacterium]
MMSNPVAQCTHVKTNGKVCGSPAVSGTAFCYHHAAVKAALGKVQPNSRAGNGVFAPIPFVFPEDRASMQINFFLLLQAFNEGRIDLKHFKAMMSMLKSMAANLGKSGSLTEEREQKSGAQSSGRRAQEEDDEDEDDPFADLRHLPESEFNDAMRDRVKKMFAEERAAEEQKQAGGNAARLQV